MQRFGSVGKKITLEHDFHSCPKRTLLHSGADPVFGIAERQNFTSLGPTATPPRRERYYRAVLTDERGDNSEPTLNITELDQRAAGRKNQFCLRREPSHVFSPDRQAIARVEKRSIDIAEQGNSRELNRALRIRAHGS